MKTPHNDLIYETSPYLLQHAYNPVHWYPWSEKAWNKAKKEQKPIFLSIGYSSCHWCHVMEKESFEDIETAEILNKYFVSIKVDREERPDIDHIYMTAVSVLTERGGWPLSAFLTPELKPFYGGTYFPKTDHYGLPGFKKVLLHLSQAWNSQKNELIQSSEKLTDVIYQIYKSVPTESNELTFKPVEDAVSLLEQAYDVINGGFYSAPKFFHTTDLQLLLREGIRNNNPKLIQRVSHTLSQISKGGIHDHLAGGFHRYSTDEKWFIPHFEKMLYDNGLLISLFVETFLAEQNTKWLFLAKKTADFVLSEMTSKEGAFFSTLDADSEGEEGKFYVWTLKEIEILLGSLAESFCKTYGVEKEGNWEERKNILYLKEDAESSNFLQAKEILLQAREKKVRPFRDEKILVSWNSWMASGFCKLYQATKESRYLEAANRACHFILNSLYDADLGLCHSFKDSKKQDGFLEDYSSFILALTDLYQSSWNPTLLEKAKKIMSQMIELFWEDGFFYYAPKKQDLIVRLKEEQDGATPSSSALAIEACLRLGFLLEDTKLIEVAETALKNQFEKWKSHPKLSSKNLLNLIDFLSGYKQIYIIKGNTSVEPYLEFLRQTYLGPTVILQTEEHKDKKKIENKTTLYVCHRFTCHPPITDLASLIKTLEQIK